MLESREEKSQGRAIEQIPIGVQTQTIFHPSFNPITDLRIKKTTYNTVAFRS